MNIEGKILSVSALVGAGLLAGCVAEGPDAYGPGYPYGGGTVYEAPYGGDYYPYDTAPYGYGGAYPYAYGPTFDFTYRDGRRYDRDGRDRGRDDRDDRRFDQGRGNRPDGDRGGDFRGDPRGAQPNAVQPDRRGQERRDLGALGGPRVDDQRRPGGLHQGPPPQAGNPPPANAQPEGRNRGEGGRRGDGDHPDADRH